MKAHDSGVTDLDIVGSRTSFSAQQILASSVKHWRRRLGYCSVFAAVPALLVSPVDSAPSKDAKQIEPNRAMQRQRRQLLNWNLGSPSLLKRQSDFVLPHQRKNGDDLSPPVSAGADDCPGRVIPAGVYTASSPYTDSGDTTGANSTINSVGYYYYYSFDAFGPDLVYTFTVSDTGPNPEIQVSRTGGAYEPLIYIVAGFYPGSCPAGIQNNASAWWTGVSSSGVARLNNLQYLPKGVPLYLFVDGSHADATGSGPYTLRIEDVTIGPACTNANPISCSEFFVRQQYWDFLGREPDSIGFANWSNTLRNCPNDGFGEFDNPQCDRVHVSAGFYLSEEFRGRGYWAYRFYEVALNRAPTVNEFNEDLYRVGGSQSPQQEANSKTTYTINFIFKPEFTARYDNVSNSAYVSALEANAEVTLPNKQSLIDALNAGTKNRATVLREIVESKAVEDRFFVRAFVAMQYFGYLHRDPDPVGFQNWVNTLEADPGNYRHMIYGFIYSNEYQSRFGPVQ